MADLLGLHGYNKSDGTEKLLAVWKQAPMIYNSSTGGWNKAPIALTVGTKAEMRTFLDEVFFVNGTDPDYTFDNDTWSTTRKLHPDLTSKFVEVLDARAYKGNIKIGTYEYKSRIWQSDLPTANKDLTWGLEYGEDLVQTASSAVVTSATGQFLTNKIKIGDKFVILSGSNAGEYLVKSIDSELQITLTESLTNTATGSDFWVGSNYFDVETDDGDEINGFGKRASDLVIFKRNSLHKYNARSKELTPVSNARGTTSRRSIISHGGYVYYYYPKIGFLRFDGIQSTPISNAMQDIVDVILTANQTEIVGWVEEEEILCWYVGSITYDQGTISNCIICLDTTTNTWSLTDRGMSIKAATVWLESNVPNVYVGNENSQVHKLATGNNFNGTDIPMDIRTHPIYPLGSGTEVSYTRLRIYLDKVREIGCQYKLVYKKRLGRQSGASEWVNDTRWNNMTVTSRGSMVEYRFPSENRDTRASGVMLRFFESSSKGRFTIEKAELFYSNPSNI